MLVHCIGGDYSLVSTKEDFNTNTGIYLTMAKCAGNPDFCVLETGMSALRTSHGSISKWIRPHICVITDVRIGRTAYYKAKVCEGMPPGGAAVLNGGMTQFDYVRAEVVKYGARPVSYGLDPSCDAHISLLERSGQWTKIRAAVLGEEIHYVLPLTGKTVLLDSLAALTVMKLSGLNIQAMSKKLSGYPADDCISAVVRIKVPGGDAVLLDACHDGETSSNLAVALEILNEEAGRDPDGGRKIAVLGDAEDKRAALLPASGIDAVFGYGEGFRDMTANAYTDADSLADAVYGYINGGDCLLVKGSRADDGMRKVIAAVTSGDGADAGHNADADVDADGLDIEFLMRDRAPWYDADATEAVYEREAAGEIQTPAYGVYSLDKMVMLQSGGVDKEINEGLGGVLLLNYMLQLLCEKKITLADETVIQNWAPEDRNRRNAIGLEFKERVSTGLLLEALVVANAPDAIMALTDLVHRIVKRPVRQNLNEMARRLGLSAGVFKNVTGRDDGRVKQSFFLEDLFKISMELFSQPLDGLKLLRTVFTVYKGKAFETDSVLHAADDVIYYYCFGDLLYHAIALARMGEERVCVCVCGARTPYERDAAVCKTLFSNQRKISVVFEPVWRPVGENQSAGVVTVAGNTYFGDGNGYSLEEADVFLSEDSFNIVNFEAALTKLKTSPFQRYLDHVFRDDPKRAAAEMKAHHIHGVMLANGHSMDYGGAGCRQTLKTLRGEQILAAGAGQNASEAERPLFLTAGGCQILFFNVCAFDATGHYLRRQYAMGANPGAACLSDSYRGLLRSYRGQYPDAFIIVSPHWSRGFSDRPDEMRRLAAQVIAAGADCVIGHGAHEVSGFEMIHGKLVLYSLGDFLFNHDTDTSGEICGYVARLRFADDSVEVRIYPIAARDANGRLRPHPVEPEEFQKLAQRFQIPSVMGRTDEKGRYFAVKVSQPQYRADSKDS
jgi:poly-gamma-glutamate capsule biosynthesis protein CapA/YwtB (metallophosphatase superfamily)/UDP-N-acetylmuramyl pentapeptide synthase